MICGKMPVNQMDKYISGLEAEIQYLKKLLDKNGISYDYEAHLRTLQSDVGDVVFPELGPEHASLLYSYFKGRRDVYALRARNGQGYYTQCNHFWKTGICPKKSGVKIKCQDCPSRAYTELRGKVILDHLQGNREDCGDVVGLYPLFSDGPGLGITELNEELIAEHINPDIPGIWEPTDEWDKEFSNDRIWS